MEKSNIEKLLASKSYRITIIKGSGKSDVWLYFKKLMLTASSVVMCAASRVCLYYNLAGPFQAGVYSGSRAPICSNGVGRRT